VPNDVDDDDDDDLHNYRHTELSLQSLPFSQFLTTKI
jgi:hypothetical protein